MDFMNSSELNYSHYYYYVYDNYYNRSWDELVYFLHSQHSLGVYQVVAAVICIVVFVVGVPGNALVLWVTRSEAPRSVNAIWFRNLAVADLLSCLVMPFIALTIMYPKWPLSLWFCFILPSLLHFNLYASVLFLATISADRFLMVFKPFWCQKYRTAWLAWLVSGMVWMLVLLLSISFFLIEIFYSIPYSRNVYGVFIGPHIVNIMRIVLFFLGPLITMSVCYTCLLLRTWQRPATRSTKTLKVLVAMVTSFFVFWLPYQLFLISLILHVNINFGFLMDMVWVALASINCCINPIIYVAAAGGLHIRVFKFRPGRLRQLLTED